jgi:hypothetical protein
MSEQVAEEVQGPRFLEEKPSLGQLVSELVPEDEDEPVPERIPELEIGQSANGHRDPDRYLNHAKLLVVDNYNEHHDPDRGPELTMDDVYISMFSTSRGNWTAVVMSSLFRGLLWIVSYNAPKHEAHIGIYKKIKNVKTRD